MGRKYMCFRNESRYAAEESVWAVNICVFVMSLGMRQRSRYGP